MRSTMDWGELGIQTNRDRRRETRLPLHMAIEVAGFGQDGKFFVEETRTVDVSDSGCSFTLTRPVGRGGIVAIKARSSESVRADANKPFLYQVARAVEERGGWVIGAAKLQAESLWALAFPKEEQKKEAVS